MDTRKITQFRQLQYCVNVDMLRTLLLALAFLKITSTTFGNKSKTLSPIEIPEILNFDDVSVRKSVRDGTFVINIIVSSARENSFLDQVVKKYTDLAPLVVQKLPTKYRTQSTEYKSGSNTIGLVLGVYDMTADINVKELELAFGNIWSPRAHIVLWVCKVANRTIDEVFEDFWVHDVLNVDLVAQDSSAGGWDVFTYNPFVTGVNGVRGSVEKLDSGVPGLVRDKLANLRNHSIPISVFHQFPSTIMTRDFKSLNIGADTELLRVISREMNFNIDLKTANSESVSYVTTLENNQRTGVIGDIINGRSDVVWNRQYVDSQPHKFIELTYPYHTSKTCIIVRKADQVPMMARVVLPFPLAIWCAVFTVLCVLVIFMILAKEKNIFPRMIYLLLFQNLGRIPNKNVNRIYSISGIFWSLLMVVIYQANLTKDLMMPKFYNDIDTLDDLYDSEISLAVGYNMFSMINNSEIQTLRRFTDRTEVELNFYHCIDRVIRREAMACTSHELESNFIPMREIYRGQNGPKLYKMKEHLTDHWEAFMVKRGFPYLNKFNHLIKQLMEGGFYDKWMKDTLAWYITHEPKYDDTILTMKHFKGAFCILLLGTGISLLTFLIETCHGRFYDTGARMYFVKLNQKTR